ncbi:hypothetical protein GCM10009804_75110 [Kribbella hippodromi]|uniref:histidine kinase n=1 Tax=Kribbella hippodromi TaxID=434347 RepID=A0ABN2EI96_9ACTN
MPDAAGASGAEGGRAASRVAGGLGVGGGLRAPDRLGARGTYGTDRVLSAPGALSADDADLGASALGVVRGDGVRPVPGVGELGGLIEQVRASGWSVVAVVDEPPYSVEAGLGLTVYRVVQEGLTNVMKHAGAGAAAEVEVRWTADAVVITVADDGGGRTGWVEGGAGAGSGAGAGHGLVGMRERVAVYAGAVELRGRAGGGAVLTATATATVPVVGGAADGRGGTEVVGAP